MNITEIKTLLRENKTTCKELVEKHLLKIEENKNLNCFISIFEEKARKKAQEVDDKLQSNTAGELAGTIIGIKDVICVKD